MKNNNTKKLISLVISILIIISALAALSIPSSAAENDKIVITIDPGHGGDDPGNTKAATLYANGDKSHYESRHTYDISMYVKERLLQYKHVEVHLTRGDLDESVPCPSLESRPDFALEKGSDAFVSIHTNVYNSTVSGTEIHVPSKDISYNNSVAITSRAAAEVVLDNMVEKLGTKARSFKHNLSDSDTYPTGEKADKLRVLRQGRKNNVPVVMLIETAFADNEGDFTKYLSTTEKRREVGYAIADGLAEYYNLELINQATVPYFCGVATVNGMLKDYKSSLEGGVIAIDSNDMDLPARSDQTIKLGGWMAIDGGVEEYLYSINHGVWNDLSGGADGEPEAGYYESLGFSDATQNSLFMPESKNLSIDLSNFEGQTVTVTVAARSAKNNVIIPFLVIVNYNVPIIIPEGLSAKYGDTLGDVTLPAGWEWANADGNVGNAGTSKKPAVFTAGDGTKHSIDLEIAVSKIDPEYTVPQNLKGQFKSKLGTVSLPSGWTWSSSQALMNELGEVSFKATFTPQDKNNYNTVSVLVTVNVSCTDHIYENKCDTTCECGFTREIEHTYTNACDAYCDVCNFERTPSPHEYSKVCDPFCDICEAEREVEHTHDNSCDSLCNVCDTKRDIQHTYTDDTDTECNICGAVRATLSVTAKTGGCKSSVSGIIAVITSIAVGFFILKKKK